MKQMRGALITMLPVLAAATACSGATVPADLTGSWGGEHIALTVTGAGATVEYDCAHGTIDEPLHPDASGRFAARGEHAVEHGGPVLEGEVPERHPAAYAGRVRGREMTLRVAVPATGQELGPFTLRRNEPPRVFRCY